ncbi:MAG TPA: hypothetical protein VMN38_10470 [Sphingomicrobium sp.]|nr:hypothetical protein [Sphingomicrobium sp.]
MSMLLSLLLASTTMSQERPAVPEIQLQQDEVDAIQPVKISHHVDEIAEGDRLVERYNYVVYEFENEAGYLWARTYLEEVEKVAIYGPFTDRTRTTKAIAPNLETAVVSYLKRRFDRIDRLNPDKNAPDAYETLWRRSAQD